MRSEFSPAVAEHNKVVSCLHNRAVEYNSGGKDTVLRIEESDQSSPPGLKPEWITVVYSIEGKERSLKLEYAEVQTNWTIATQKGSYEILWEGKPPKIGYSGGDTPDEIAKALLDKLLRSRPE